MARFRKKPVVIDAIQWTGKNLEEIKAFMAPAEPIEPRHGWGEEKKIQIATPEGIVTADQGDWIIRGVAGELYPCKPDIFDATYEIERD